MKILIIRFSALGDLVTFDPHYRAIKKCFSTAKIDFLTTGLGKALYSDSEYFDEFIIYDKFKSVLSKLKINNYNLIVNLQCNKNSHYLTLLTPCKTKVNISSNIIQKVFKLKHQTKSIKEMLSSANCNELIIKNYIEDKANLEINLPFSKNVMTLDFKNDNKIIGISTGSSEKWVSKKWGVSNYKFLIKKLIENNFNVVLIGTELELEDEKDIKKDIKSLNFKSFVNKTNLVELKSLISKIDLFIGNDSGPAHIAAGVNIDTISIFTSTDVKHCVNNLPYLGTHLYIKPKDYIKCHPCYKSKCPTNMECAGSITVDDILNKIKYLKV